MLTWQDVVMIVGLAVAAFALVHLFPIALDIWRSRRR